jgi:UDP-glucose 4-epimerase
MACAEDMGDYFRVPPDGRDLNYAKFFDQGDAHLTETTHGEDYNSHNTARLDLEGMTRMLLKLEGMQRIARGEVATVEES